MITVKSIPSYRRPYADTKYEYEVTAEGMTDEEVEQYCKEKVHKVSKKETDNRWFGEKYYTFKKSKSNTYWFTVVEPTCK